MRLGDVGATVAGQRDLQVVDVSLAVGVGVLAQAMLDGNRVVGASVGQDRGGCVVHVAGRLRQFEAVGFIDGGGNGRRRWR